MFKLHHALIGCAAVVVCLVAFPVVAYAVTGHEVAAAQQSTIANPNATEGADLIYIYAVIDSANSDARLPKGAKWGINTLTILLIGATTVVLGQDYEPVVEY